MGQIGRNHGFATFMEMRETQGKHNTSKRKNVQKERETVAHCINIQDFRKVAVVTELGYQNYSNNIDAPYWCADHGSWSDLTDGMVNVAQHVKINILARRRGPAKTKILFLCEKNSLNFSYSCKNVFTSGMVTLIDIRVYILWRKFSTAPSRSRQVTSSFQLISEQTDFAHQWKT